MVAGQSALAMSVTYPLKIKITQQDTQGVCPKAGTIMPMTITVDRAFPVTPPKEHTEHYHGGSGYNTASPILSVSINNAASYEPQTDDIYVTKDHKGSYGYSFAGFTASGGEGFTLDFSSTNASAVKTYGLPPILFPKNFSTATFTYDEKEAPCLGTVIAR